MIPVAALIFTGLMGILTIALPRRLAPLPFLLGAIFVPLELSIVVGGIHLFMFRILIVFAWLRLVVRGEFRFGGIRALDWAVLLFVASAVIIYTTQWQSTEALINRLGFAFNALGAYFFFRCMMRDAEDMSRMVKFLSFAAVLVAISVIVEGFTGRNVFSVLGGVTEFTEIRDGRLRCQGPFAHSILAGTFGATVFPIFAMFSAQASSKKWAAFGCLASVIIVFESASSGPILTLAAAIAALAFWPLRTNMRPLRWLASATIVSLHLAMKAPVWALIGRATVFGSSSGDHRYEIIDAFIRNFDEWWLLGTRSNGDWGYLTLDLSNNYVRTGVDGGLLTLVMFFVIVICCFKAIGRGLRNFSHPLPIRKLMWGLGSALFATLVAFVGVNYWDQSIVMWYLLLAAIASTIAIIPAERPESTTPELSVFETANTQ